MTKSKNSAVEKFLEEIREFDTVKCEILQKLRSIVFSAFPKVSERIMYGGIMFTLEEDFGGLFASNKHISFEFGGGYLFDDPQKLLEGTGKYRRHLKIRTLSDIQDKCVEFFVKQVV